MEGSSISKNWTSWKIKCSYIVINLNNILPNYLTIPQIRIEAYFYIYAKEIK